MPSCMFISAFLMIPIYACITALQIVLSFTSVNVCMLCKTLGSEAMNLFFQGGLGGGGGGGAYIKKQTVAYVVDFKLQGV